MGKIAIFIFILFLAGLGGLAYVNQEITTIKIPFGDAYETSKIALILFSCVAGACDARCLYYKRHKTLYR